MNLEKEANYITDILKISNLNNINCITKNLPQSLVVAGIDEAGRGPLAGPVVAAAVIVDYNNLIDGVKDSKKLSLKKRDLLYHQITKQYLFATGIISPEVIDEINILEATKKACFLALSNLPIKSDLVLIDGNMQFNQQNIKSIIKGDDLFYSIAAASIIAKVTRDRLMQQLAHQFPNYGWDKNSGYGSASHIAAIKQYGPTQYHRKSFKIK